MRKVSGKIRLTDIAEAAHTSVATVSMALVGHPRISDATRKRVQQICRELGYRPRRSLPALLQRPAQLRDRLRLAFFAINKLDHPINATLVQALSHHALTNDARLEVISLPPETDPETAIDTAIQLGRTVDGLMLMGSITIAQLRAIEQASIPCVLYGYPIGAADQDERPVPVITSDFAGIGRRATATLIECGHRRIGFVSGSLTPGGWHARCLDGYASAHLHNNLDIDRGLIFAADLSAGENSGGWAARRVLAMEPSRRPSAFVAINTGTAARFLATLKDEGGITVPLQHIVICGLPHLMPEFGLEDYPLVHMDPAKVVEAAVNQLKSECMKRSGWGTTVIVPFSTRNLPTRPTEEPAGR